MYNLITKILFSLIIISSPISAVVYVYDLSTEFSGASEPVGPTPWATASFQDINSNTIQLDLSAVNLTGSEFIGAWYLNFNDDLDVNALNFNRIGGSTSATTDISTGSNLFKADGDGFFDILVDFSKNVGERMTAGENLLFEISSVNPISSEMFNFGSAPGGGNGTWYSAAHVQGINGEDSGWIGSGPGVAVPEPSTYLILGSMLGSVMLLAYRRRKRAS
jgi:hypothetical protein